VDPNGTKAEGMGLPPMMRRMMEKMCGGTGDFDPAALCREMKGAGAAEEVAGTGGWAMPACCKATQASGREAGVAPDPHGP
jgi:hypothetical protein